MASGGATTTYGYDSGGRLTSTALPTSNGYVESRSYDRAGRLDLIRNAKNGVTLSMADYTYDSVGKPVRVVTEAETITYT